tara:strand:- start:968 stop:1633 length:666 start_codon:yes stop_codon:yes gene_type:complete
MAESLFDSNFVDFISNFKDESPEDQQNFIIEGSKLNYYFTDFMEKHISTYIDDKITVEQYKKLNDFLSFLSQINMNYPEFHYLINIKREIISQPIIIELIKKKNIYKATLYNNSAYYSTLTGEIEFLESLLNNSDKKKPILIVDDIYRFLDIIKELYYKKARGSFHLNRTFTNVSSILGKRTGRGKKTKKRNRKKRGTKKRKPRRKSKRRKSKRRNRSLKK